MFITKRFYKLTCILMLRDACNKYNPCLFTFSRYIRLSFSFIVDALLIAYTPWELFFFWWYWVWMYVRLNRSVAWKNNNLTFLFLLLLVFVGYSCMHHNFHMHRNISTIFDRNVNHAYEVCHMYERQISLYSIYSYFPLMYFCGYCFCAQ